MRFPQAELFPQSQEAFKVGGLYVNVTGNNPANELGYGVWEAWGQGKTPVGVDPGDPDFDAAEKTGGAKTVTLTAAESGVPAHSHGVTDPGHEHVETNNSATTGPLVGFAARDTSTNNQTATGYSTMPATTGISVNDNAPANAAQAHQNMPPFLTCFFWKRTA